MRCSESSDHHKAHRECLRDEVPTYSCRMKLSTSLARPQRTCFNCLNNHARFFMRRYASGQSYLAVNQAPSGFGSSNLSLRTTGERMATRRASKSWLLGSIPSSSARNDGREVRRAPAKRITLVRIQFIPPKCSCSSLVEPWVEGPWVVGSIPTASTKYLTGQRKRYTIGSVDNK